jgi:hypothetical protein
VFFACCFAQIVTDRDSLALLMQEEEELVIHRLLSLTSI